VDEEEVFERLKKFSRPNLARYGLDDRRARSVLVGVLLVFAVVLSASSGEYAGASFFPQDNVTTTVYSTTTSWITSTVWSTVTEVVQGVLTTTTYTTITSTVTATSSSSPTTIGTSITLYKVTSNSGRVTVTGVLKDASGKGLQGLQIRVTIDGGYKGTTITSSGGSFTYTGPGPYHIMGVHVVTVWFDQTAQYSASTASLTYRL
jgi:hypothetical protein